MCFCMPCLNRQGLSRLKFPWVLRMFPKRGATFQVISIFAWGLFLSFMLRTVNAAIASDLSSDLSLTSSQLGSLSSAYFLGFAIMQLPLGILLDRLGARRVQAMLFLIAALACWGFALSHTYGHLWWSRAFMGVGTAGALMAALKAFRFWYAANRQQLLATVMMMSGTSGALFATVPVRWIVNEHGWRSVFATSGFVLLLAAVLVAILLPRDEERATRKISAESSKTGYIKANITTYRQIFTDGYFWRFGLLSILMHGGIGAMQALWLGPWLTNVQGFTPDQVAQRLLYFNLAMLVGYLMQMWLLRYTRLGTVSMPALIAGVAMLVISVQLGLMLWSSPYAWVLWLVLAVLTTCFTLILPHMSLSFSPSMTGRAYVAYNILIFSGNWLVQTGFGAVIHAADTKLGITGVSAYRLALLVWIAAQSVGVMWLLVSKAQPARPHA